MNAASAPNGFMPTSAPEPSTLIDHPSGYLALSPRNLRFTIDGLAGFIAYRAQGRHLIAFGGVHAARGDCGELLDSFLDYAEAQKRRVAVVQLREPQTRIFLERGFTINQFGTSFSLNLQKFSLSGTSKMKLRNKISRARKAGLRIAEVGRELPRDEATFAQLKAISTEWLHGKGKELDFMIGELGCPAEASRRIFVIVDSRGRGVAFITYVPAWGQMPGYLHDLTRRLPIVPPGAMELCNGYAIERMKAEGVGFLHFGFTPFVTDGNELPGANRAVAWAVRKLGKHGSFLYPAQSQAQYKLKWGPDVIEPEYLAARRMSLRAILDLLVLTKSV